jgi:hypothetical protein
MGAIQQQNAIQAKMGATERHIHNLDLALGIGHKYYRTIRRQA